VLFEWKYGIVGSSIVDQKPLCVNLGPPVAICEVEEDSDSDMESESGVDGDGDGAMTGAS
jgi:hypothetical protein